MLTAKDMKPGTLLEKVGTDVWAVVVDMEQLHASGPVKGRKGVPVIGLDGKLRWLRRSRLTYAGGNVVIAPIQGIRVSPLSVRSLLRLPTDKLIICRHNGLFDTDASANDYRLM